MFFSEVPSAFQKSATLAAAFAKKVAIRVVFMPKHIVFVPFLGAVRHVTKYGEIDYFELFRQFGWYTLLRNVK